MIITAISCLLMFVSLFFAAILGYSVEKKTPEVTWLCMVLASAFAASAVAMARFM
jgi:ABC-type antimicrobial peptide transport system permease subunit